MNLLKAPKQGTMYAIYIDKEVVYKPYTREELFKDADLEVNLLELHLFDKEKEYRYIKKRKGYIETEISDETVELDDKYEETIFTLKKNQEKPDENHSQVKVINYIKYDENDLLTIQDYRLAEV